MAKLRRNLRARRWRDYWDAIDRAAAGAQKLSCKEGSMGGDEPVFTVQWAMPSRATFSIPPIADFVGRWVAGASIVVDPFCGQSKVATHRNDLAQGGVDAQE